MEITQNGPHLGNAEIIEKQSYVLVGKRLLAQVVDTLLLYVIALIMVAFLGILILFGAVPDHITESRPFNMVTSVGYSIVYVLYFSYFESRKQQATFGKRLFKLRVTDIEGNRLNFSHALRRNFLKIISGLSTLYIGYIMVLCTRKKQGFHDIITKSLVVASPVDLNKR
ncbi:RDD family protein [Paenibacillus eucommiae]|uniref:RDD family membrane protein YckC n=1 Tax=Paenibacillus eucommiae TaxID=1355755 RepID=A0ABS4IMJ5_9BACL|nr:RDD family protein [Paenibacillus eucommiae]MBP1988787.1 putative RDD family membrane protein YckC [Paenibacillus eucommiae]